MKIHKLLILFYMLTFSVSASSMGIVLFDEPLLNDPFATQWKYSQAIIEVDRIYALKKSDEMSQIDGLSVFEITQDYLKDKNATIISIQRKDANIVYTEPFYEIAKDVKFLWYAVKWKDASQNKMHCFAVIENGTIIQGTEYSSPPKRRSEPTGSGQPM